MKGCACAPVTVDDGIDVHVNASYFQAQGFRQLVFSKFCFDSEKFEWLVLQVAMLCLNMPSQFVRAHALQVGLLHGREHTADGNLLHIHSTKIRFLSSLSFDCCEFVVYTLPH